MRASRAARWEARHDLSTSRLSWLRPACSRRCRRNFVALVFDGRLDCLISNGPSPNGLVLSPDEAVLFVAMTRDNSIWRVPLMRDGGVGKVGRFSLFFGTSGPDGLTMDQKGRLFVAHASLGHVFVMAPNGETIARIKSCAGATCTNLVLESANGTLLITESSTGSVLMADLAHFP